MTFKCYTKLRYMMKTFYTLYFMFVQLENKTYLNSFFMFT